MNIANDPACNCGGTITHMAVVIEDQTARIAALEAENAKLRSQVEFVKRRHHDNDGEGWCGVCGYRGQDQQYGHELDCPHAEAK